MFVVSEALLDEKLDHHLSKEHSDFNSPIART